MSGQPPSPLGAASKRLRMTPGAAAAAATAASCGSATAAGGNAGADGLVSPTDAAAALSHVLGAGPSPLQHLLGSLAHAALQNNPVELMDFAAGFLTKLAEAHRCRLQDHGGSQPMMTVDQQSDRDSSDGTLGAAATAAGGGAGQHNDDDGDDIMDSEFTFPPNYSRHKRKSVYAEPVRLEDLEDEEAHRVVHPKTPEQVSMLMSVLRELFLFKQLPVDELAVVVDAMFRCETNCDEQIIRQGDEGDNFYVVESGLYEVYVNGERVGSYDNAGSFGELALMYNSPRAATILCKAPGVLWALGRPTFQRILLKHALCKRQLYESYLESLPILECLTKEEKARLSDGLEPVAFQAGQNIIKQGDPADCFYFVVDGTVRVTRTTEQSGGVVEVEIAKLHKGAYFGELALITQRPRAANIWAETPVNCTRLTTDAFERLLGPCIELMRSHITSYEHQLQQVLGPAENGGSHLGLE